MSQFIFVGYLIQEPYWTTWPMREGLRVASIERESHPQLNQHQWDEVEGIKNPTRFLTHLPCLNELALEPHTCQSVLHMLSPGWVVSGYSLEKNVVEHRTISAIDGGDKYIEFGYALKLHRAQDNLKLLGYEIVDEEDLFFSILNNCGYTMQQVHEMAGPLNEYSLLASVQDAKRFADAIKTDSNNPRIVPDHNQGLIVQVWGWP